MGDSYRGFDDQFDDGLFRSGTRVGQGVRGKVPVSASAMSRNTVFESHSSGDSRNSDHINFRVRPEKKWVKAFVPGKGWVMIPA